MESILGLRDAKPRPSPLEGGPAHRARQAESAIRQLRRREWWLWLSAFFVTALSAVAFLLSSFPSLFRRNEHFYNLGSDQVRWAVMCLLLLFKRTATLPPMAVPAGLETTHRAKCQFHIACRPNLGVCQFGSGHRLVQPKFHRTATWKRNCPR